MLIHFIFSSIFHPSSFSFVFPLRMTHLLLWSNFSVWTLEFILSLPLCLDPSCNPSLSCIFKSFLTYWLQTCINLCHLKTMNSWSIIFSFETMSIHTRALYFHFFSLFLKVYFPFSGGYLLIFYLLTTVWLLLLPLYDFKYHMHSNIFTFFKPILIYLTLFCIFPFYFFLKSEITCLKVN